MTAEQPPVVGQQMYQWAKALFPIPRSLTGDGVRQTLAFLGDLLPGLAIHQVPSGTQVFDWVVPKEWNIRSATITSEAGEVVVDFARHNLHVVGYSVPVDAWMSREELDAHLYSLPDKPDWIPYVTSYYAERWGFCLSQRQRDALPAGRYHVKIDATLEPGHLTYGELILPGRESTEVFLSTYICHPSLGNNEISGPVVTAALARWLMDLPDRRLTYRIVFIPETIGSIAYLSRHLDHLKRSVVAGFVITCVGDDRCYSFLPSRGEASLADRAAKHVLADMAPEGYNAYPFLEGGSDERQYCSPGVDLPMATIMRSKYGCYPEYHTSADDLDMISPQGLAGGYEALRRCLAIFEADGRYRTTVLGDPQLGKRGLYPTISVTDSWRVARAMMQLLSYCDGTHDVIALAEKVGLQALDAVDILAPLLKAGLIERVAPVYAQESP